MPLLYPGVKVSYGTIQQMLVEAEGRAARFNAQVSLGGVEAGALDEMFSQGEPVLAGVDLDSGYLFGLSLSATRDGEAWAGLLREGEALGRLGKIRAYDKERWRKAKRALSSARRECAEAIERFDAFEAAMDTLRGALECVDLETGELHRPEHVQALIVCRKKEDRAASRQRRFFSGRSAPPMRMQPRNLAYCLYDICANKRRDAGEAASYNGLIAVWSELTRQAAAIHDTRGDLQGSLEL